VFDRAADIGLLTCLAGTQFTIQPALTWVLHQLFDRYYDGYQGRSTATDALRAWVNAVGKVGDYYHGQFKENKRESLQFVHFEEANLLQAHRLARRHGWWECDIHLIQGLEALYQQQIYGHFNWWRLVAEITPDYCTADDAPVPGRENEYSMVMDFRVQAARLLSPHPVKRRGPLGSSAAALQEKKITWCRHQAAPTLALPPDAPLDHAQRRCISDLGASVLALGEILMSAGKPECVESFQESLGYARRIQDAGAEARIHSAFGKLYRDIRSHSTLFLRDLNVEAACQRSLAFCDPNDALARSRSIILIGAVHCERFRDFRVRREPAETVMLHAQAAEKYSLEALSLCPETAFQDLDFMYNLLGDLYKDLGRNERAWVHYEKRAQVQEQNGQYGEAGLTRYGLARMYALAALGSAPDRRRDLLNRARTYAEAALQDYSRVQGHPENWDYQTLTHLDFIKEELANLA
jgi:hypothetical protein